MSNLLCFGDSNTWGFDAEAEGRHPRALRWPTVLARELGPDAHVAEAGQNGRTTATDDPQWQNRNGRKALAIVLESHAPLDLVIFMLGLNDLKDRLGLTAADAARGMGALVQFARARPAWPVRRAPEVLVVAPPPVQEVTGRFAKEFVQGAAQSRLLAKRYEEVARAQGAHFFDAGPVTGYGKSDGLHLDAAGHQALGLALAPVVQSILRQRD
ncbi:MAG: SGNH/GDSL hydrolase family protein [Verrucomicrobiota bacterium]